MNGGHMMTSDVKKELMSELKMIWNNKDFVCGAMSNAGSEAAWKEMLDYIQTAKSRGESVSSDEILLMSLDIGDTGLEKKSIVARKSAKIAML